MRMSVLKRMALTLLAVVLALTWARSGRAQADCIVERGQDPLEVLLTGAKHNVFIGLDNSGTMSSSFLGTPAQGPESYGPDKRDTNVTDVCGGIQAGDCSARLRIAKDVLTSVINDPDLNDSEGKPLVNWGFFYTASQNDSVGNLGAMSCAVPQKDANLNFVLDSECVGLDADKTFPSTCEFLDSKEIILDKLMPRYLGGIKNNGGTANAISLNQMAGVVKQNYMGANQKPGQRNFIIYITDGFEDCSCEKKDGSGNPLPISFTAGTAGVPLGSVPFLASGKPALRNDDVAPFDPTQNIPVGTNNSLLRGYNMGIMSQHALQIIDPNLDGSQGDIFIVLIGQNNASTRAVNTHWGWEASGVSLGRPVCPASGGLGCARPGGFAGNEQTMKEAIKNAVLQVGVPSATVSLGAPVVGSVKEVVASHTNTTQGLTGADLLASGAADTQVRTLRVSHRNNVLFTTSLDTPGFAGHLKAFNNFEVQADQSRTADFTEIWDAGEVLRDRELSVDPRRIFYNLPDETGGQLSSTLGTTSLAPSDLGVAAGFLSDLDPTGQGAKTNADAVEIVEKVIQGWRLVVDSTNGFYNGANLNFVETELDGEPTWKLFEATNSAPAVVLNPPRSPDTDPPQPSLEYQTFFDDQINRMTVVYLGTNGGMIHAFRADNGYELYGYIPHDLLTKLPSLVRNLVSGNNGVLNHEFFVASSATVQDAFLQDSPNGSPEWRTVLAFGRGPGGKFLTALDITDVGEWDGTNSPSVPTGFQPPELLFTVGNRDGVVDLDPNGESYDGLGETWSVPVMGRVNNGGAEGQWVLFAGSGYGCVGTDEGRFLYVLKLEDGSVVRKLGPISDVVDGAAGDLGVDQNALVATPALFNPHEPGVNDGRDFITRVYIGDLQGLVHKLDCTDADPANWELGVFFEVTSEADLSAGQGNHDQPIAVQAAILKLATTNRILIFLGTGGDSRVEQQEPDRFKMVGMEDADSLSPIAANDPAFAGNLILTDAGDLFFFDLPEGHRALVAPVTARNTSTNGVVFFASSSKELVLVSCTVEFTSTLTAAAVTGGLGVFDLDPTLGGVQGTVDLGQGKTTGLFHRDEHLYVSKSGGLGVAGETMVLGGDTFPSPPTAAGNLQLLVETFRLSPF